MPRARSLCHTDALRSAFIIQCTLIVALAAPADAGQAAARALTSGEAIFQAGCAGCHGPDGRGAPDTTVGFEKPDTFPDFTDCPTTTPEKDVDWWATIHDGGRGRGFSRIMPSFADALTAAQIDAVIRYMRGLCRDPKWPRGELNLPRAIATEKAYPESETVVTAAIDAHRAPDVTNALVYEQRFGIRNQIEVSVPFTAVHDNEGRLARGVGDIGLGLKRVLFAGSTGIVSVQGEAILPTGDHTRGLGAGVGVFEGFAAYGQMLGPWAFVQVQAGGELPASSDDVARAAFGRVAIGRSIRQEHGYGRMWTPMLELLADREFEEGARTSVDILPQIQVTVNRRQHVRANVGWQIPVNNREGRAKQLVFYVLWDWFDGRLQDGWR